MGCGIYRARKFCAHPELSGKSDRACKTHNPKPRKTLKLIYSPKPQTLYTPLIDPFSRSPRGLRAPGLRPILESNVRRSLKAQALNPKLCLNLPLVSREWKNGSNSSYNCTPFLHSLLTKGKLNQASHTLDTRAQICQTPDPRAITQGPYQLEQGLGLLFCMIRNPT